MTQLTDAPGVSSAVHVASAMINFGGLAGRATPGSRSEYL
jgi:hypothetical protein